ncbi:helix-turn-helix domain-containing protein [Streptomycetaceae bacterium NBC_01309]
MLAESTHPVAVARRAAGLSITELAERAGVSHSVVSRLEGGQIANPQMEQARAIADALGGDIRSLGLMPENLHPLAEARWEAGLTQGQLADGTAVLRKTISEIEAGRVDPDAETRAAVAAGVGADVDMLFPRPPRVVDAIALVGARLREERTALGLSSQKLAERAGISKSVILAIENGNTTNPAYTSVTAIGEALVEAGADLVLAAELDLRAERARLGISQTELARYTGLNNKQISDIETGAAPPRVAAVADVRQALARISAEQAAARSEFDPATERARLGLSRRELAERLGLTVGDVEAVESGRIPLDTARIADLRQVFRQAEVEQIRALRTELKLLQEEVDVQAGLRPGTVSAVERGANSSPETIKAVRAALVAAAPPLDLAAERDRLGMSQTELAARSGLDKAAIARIEAGGRITKETLSLVEQALEQGRQEGLQDNAQIDFDLTQALEDLGISRVQLAELAGIKRQTVAAVEEGRGAQGHQASTNAAIRRALQEAEAAPPAGRALDFDVAEIRGQLGMTQRGLAARAGISKDSVVAAEAGGRSVGPQVTTRAAIRGALTAAAIEAVSARDFDPAAMRAWLGLSVAALAREAGVREATLHDWESGATERPRDGTVEAVRGALVAAVTAFFEGPAAQPQAVPQGDVFRDREVADLTVDELAELSGVSAEEITRIEHDPDYRPSEVTMRAVREGLNEADVRRFADVAPEGTQSAAAVPGDRGAGDGRPADLAASAAGIPGEPAGPAVEGSISVPVGPLSVDVPDAPARPDLPSAPPLPPHLERMGPQAAYFDASMRGFPAGRQAGAEAAARAELPWGREEGAAGGTPVLKVDRGGERLNEARRTASDNDVEADEQVGVDWEAEAPLTAPVGAAAAGQEADALREATFSGTTGAASGLTAAQVHQQRFEQAAWDGFQQGWAQTMAERALLAAQDHSELAAPDVTPDMHAEALAAIGHAPSAAPQASSAAGPEPRAEVEAGPEAGSDTGPDTGPEPGSDAASQAGPNAGRQVGSDAGPQAGPEAGRGGGSEAGPEAGRVAGPGAGPGVGSHAGLQVGSDAGPQVGSDPGREAGSDTGPQTGPDAGPQVGPDTGSQAGPGAGRGTGREAGPEVGSDAGRQAGPNAGRGAGPEVESDAGSQVGPEAGRGVGREAGSQTGPDAGRSAGREAEPQAAAQPDGASGVSSGARDPEPSRETSGPEPVSEPAPKSGPEPGPPTGQSAGAVREAAQETGSAAGRTGSADAGLAVPASSQLPGPAPGARADPALLGLSAPGTRSATAPERSVDTSVPTPAPAPAPAPEPSPGPALELEQGKEV